jgi:hypothetical protein
VRKQPTKSCRQQFRLGSDRERDIVCIVGAGFSKHAGLPLQREFIAELLAVQRFDRKGPSRILVDLLKEFAKDVFGQVSSGLPRDWPDLEDVFTCIDLSANVGHHLGVRWSPAKLRRVRGALIVRIIRMLRQKYKEGRAKKDGNWRRLERFLAVAADRCAFISMNWDTVIEEGLLAKMGDASIDYGCDAREANFPERGRTIAEAIGGADANASGVPVIKMHGSINWLYCDNCQRLYWFPAQKVFDVANQLLRPADRKSIGAARPRWLCANCKTPLGTRIATFSYRKALDFPMFQKSWFTAEKLLVAAGTWVFIGYSLPAADYEFKHLLKRVQTDETDGPSDRCRYRRLKTGSGSYLRKLPSFFWGDPGSGPIPEWTNAPGDPVAAPLTERSALLG